MTYTIFNPSDGFHYIYDSASGSVIPTGELEAYICDAMDPCGEELERMPDKCPSEIRYELARFSSTEVSAAYEKIKAYFSAGIIYGDSKKDCIRTQGEFSADEDTVRFILSKAGLSFSEVTMI